MMVIAWCLVGAGSFGGGRKGEVMMMFMGMGAQGQPVPKRARTGGSELAATCNHAAPSFLVQVEEEGEGEVDEIGGGSSTGADTAAAPGATTPAAAKAEAAPAMQLVAQAAPKPAAAAKLVEAEGSATGGVSAAVVAAYAQALGGFLVAALLVLQFVAAEGLRVGATVWLSVWTGEGGWGKGGSSVLCALRLLRFV